MYGLPEIFFRKVKAFVFFTRLCRDYAPRWTWEAERLPSWIPRLAISPSLHVYFDPAPFRDPPKKPSCSLTSPLFACSAQTSSWDFLSDPADFVELRLDAFSVFAHHFRALRHIGQDHVEQFSFFDRSTSLTFPSRLVSGHWLAVKR